MKISSPAFSEMGFIPERNTCDGDNVSPELLIEGVPPEARSLALVLEDPDAPTGTFTHWVLWNIEPDTARIPEEAETIGILGTTDFGTTGYGGPCPPAGAPHRYVFKLYALDIAADLPMSANVRELESAMEHHVIAQAELTGLFER